MLSFLFKKNQPKISEVVDNIYKKLKTIYSSDEISEERKSFLKEKIEQFGYLPYPYIQALEELTPAEILFGLEIKWTINGVFKNGHFCFEDDMLSPVQRAKFTNSDWIKTEQHDIKLINLAALGDGNKTHEVGTFIDWLRQILILPSGNIEKGVLSTTIYLIPFHSRDFGCAYLPTSSGISDMLEDKLLKENGIAGIEQIKLFVELAQLAGHPVIYDVLPQIARYSKTVLAKPTIARWFDVNFLIDEIIDALDEIAIKLRNEFDEDDIVIIKTVYKNTLRSGSDDISANYKPIYDRFTEELKEYKKVISEDMLKKNEQIKIQARAKQIIAKTNGLNPNKSFTEDDITKQGETIQNLIEAGLWPAPGGAWCSAGVPVFDKMAECGSYPLFIHYDYKGNDVSALANLDCQTPYYFVYLETGEYNNAVMDFFVNEVVKLKKTYNFDGIRVDHIDHVVDDLSEKDMVPISYRAPRALLKKLNKALKDEYPTFATLAEYMLGGNYLSEYHKEMGFDILWGNDIINQHEKTPEKIIEDNNNLINYNSTVEGPNKLSIIKTYNNQDGEFRAIDQYPSLLGEAGALFKWFKLKFLPAGKLCQRPVLYVDGDESFTLKGIEGTIVAEVSLPRAKDMEFYYKFDAIRRLALSLEQTLSGDSRIINYDDDGFVSWMISKDPLKESILVCANYQAPEEKVSIQQLDGTMEYTYKEGKDVENKSVVLPCDYKIVSEFVYNNESKQFEEQEKEGIDLHFDKLEPSEFRIFKITR